jgi:hypothetical protein
LAFIAKGLKHKRSRTEALVHKGWNLRMVHLNWNEEIQNVLIIYGWKLISLVLNKPKTGMIVPSNCDPHN